MKTVQILAKQAHRFVFILGLKVSLILTSVRYSKEINVECVMSEPPCQPPLVPVASGDTSKLEKGQDPIKEIKAP